MSDHKEVRTLEDLETLLLGFRSLMGRVKEPVRRKYAECTDSRVGRSRISRTTGVQDTGSIRFLYPFEVDGRVYVSWIEWRSWNGELNIMDYDTLMPYDSVIEDLNSRL